MLLLGFHSQVPSPELREAYRQVRPRLGKAMFHDYGFWQAVKADCPGIKLIGRLFDEWATHAMDEPIKAGRSWADRQYADPCFRDLYDYPEWLNEVFGYTNPDRWEWMDIAQEAFVDRWRELDPTKIPIAGNCGNGNLWGEEWTTFLPRTVKAARLFGFHAYGYPTMKASADYWVLRYRQVMGKIREVNPAALAIITEAGITHMVIPGYPDRGYLDEQTPEQYWDTGGLRWLNDRLLEDGYGIAPGGYMLGATVFQIGGSATPPPEPDGWASFEGLGTSIIDRMAALSPGTPSIEIGEDTIMPDYTFEGDFARFAEENPRLKLTPTSEAVYLSEDRAVQLANKGALVYVPGERTTLHKPYRPRPKV